MLKLHDCFDQPRCSGCDVEMTDVRFSSTDRAKSVVGGSAVAKGLGQRCDFNRISQWSSCAMGFDIGNGTRRDISGCVGHSDYFGLCVYAWRRIANLLGTIVVDRCSFDHGKDVVTVLQCIGETLQQDNSAAVTKNSPFCICIKGPACSIDRCHTLFFVEVVSLLRKGYRHAAREYHITLVAEQTRACLTHCNKGTGASRLNGHTRASQIQFVRHTRRHKVFVIAEHRLVLADLIVSSQFA